MPRHRSHFCQSAAIFLSLAAFIYAGASPLEAAPARVTLNADGVMVINGSKVFPIGFTVSPPPDGTTPSGKNGIAELADAGATFLRAGPLGKPWNAERFASEKATEDTAAKYGLHCWLNLREASAIKSPKDEALLRKVIATFKDHPALACYKGVDEPEWGKAALPPMDRAYHLLKELDPAHPLAVIEAPRGTLESLRRYNSVSDITGFDIYPISYPPGKHSQFVATNSDPSMVGDYTRRAVEMSDGNKPIWMTLQIAWSGVLRPGQTLRFPTFPEERFMTYQAIINGARGVMYFGGMLPGGLSARDKKLGWNWHFWDRVLRPVVVEIGSKSRLYPALVAPASRLPIKVNGPGIEFCAREVGKEIFLLACRRDHSTQKVEFTGLPPVEKQAEVLFEDPRAVAVNNGAFTDWFAPFEVHVYCFKRTGGG
ncbi:MAG TPA: hypothetical protein VHH88_10175 [Verrucomicrobiae bacterium]|nr:hypothetical protein [Verrucomicrobiae bacterium]